MDARTLYLAVAGLLFLIGLGGALLNRNLIKVVLGFSLLDVGVNLFIVALGLRPGATAPIIDNPSMLSDVGNLTVNADLVVDPVPQALVLTAIVIGLGVTALMLSYVIRLYAQRKTLHLREYGRMKW